MTGLETGADERIERWIEEGQQWSHEALSSAMDRMEGSPAPLTEAMRYALMAGGKRLRPCLVRLFCDIAGGGDDDNYEELTYEGYGPGGVAIFVEVMTDNKNRSVAEIRHAFNKMGGNLGTDGSVAYLFTKQGIISYGPEWEEDRLVEAVLNAGAEDLAGQDDGSWEIVTTPEQFLDVKESLVNAGLVPDNAEVTMVPSTRVELDRDGAETILKLIDMLEDLDDVQNVYHNADISGEIMESL